MHVLKRLGSSLTVIGSLVLMICVALLSVSWANDGRWGWFALGMVIIAVNIALVATELRPKPKPLPWTMSEVREVTAGIDNEVNAIRKLRRADRGLSLEKAAKLVSQARSEGTEGPGESSDTAR
ncbi:MAG: hypothetical protein C0482_13140 [Gordonia sp.]|uniref:Uncharacterized protein n=1 Tax=Gordonia rubripertincta TaxID=36822 RepID=A0ABT4N0S9_GORRU|nr:MULTISPECIES: hypothetical protein [Mycobacteriales]MBA4023300.1 hypothetical protein [Gordonia sp. (in: high G+C Gram-positive bacteria)]MCZ4551557.1 hypothetical protein [Gordonia rubripertincta]OZG26252.1 hypothetical protein BH683_026005 [Williamsia sp. 1138]